MSKIEVGKEYIVRGDTEQIYWEVDGEMKKYIGTKVRVIDDEYSYGFKCKCYDDDIWVFNEEDLQEIGTHTITLSLSDTKSTMSDGDKTVEVNRYYTDKYDEQQTIKELTKKFYAKPKKKVKMLCISTGKKYGIIGEETDLIDSFGEKLYIGDIVKASYNGYVSQNPIAKNDSGYIVMGHAIMTHDLITCKIKSYKDITDKDVSEYFIIEEREVDTE